MLPVDHTPAALNLNGSNMGPWWDGTGYGSANPGIQLSQPGDRSLYSETLTFVHEITYDECLGPCAGVGLSVDVFSSQDASGDGGA